MALLYLVPPFKLPGTTVDLVKVLYAAYTIYWAAAGAIALVLRPAIEWNARRRIRAMYGAWYWAVVPRGYPGLRKRVVVVSVALSIFYVVRGLSVATENE